MPNEGGLFNQDERFLKKLEAVFSAVDKYQKQELDKASKTPPRK